jgi:hypothetical protein
MNLLGVWLHIFRLIPLPLGLPPLLTADRIGTRRGPIAHDHDVVVVVLNNVLSIVCLSPLLTF